MIGDRHFRRAWQRQQRWTRKPGTIAVNRHESSGELRFVREVLRTVTAQARQTSLSGVIVYVLTDIAGEHFWLGDGYFGPCDVPESLWRAPYFYSFADAQHIVARNRKRGCHLRAVTLRIVGLCLPTVNYRE